MEIECDSLIPSECDSIWCKHVDLAVIIASYALLPPSRKHHKYIQFPVSASSFLADRLLTLRTQPLLAFTRSLAALNIGCESDEDCDPNQYCRGVIGQKTCARA